MTLMEARRDAFPCACLSLLSSRDIAFLDLGPLSSCLDADGRVFNWQPSVGIVRILLTDSPHWHTMCPSWLSSQCGNRAALGLPMGVGAMCVNRRTMSKRR